MKKSALVSFIIPCYNCSRTIQKCVESIRKQTYTNLEIILVDDGSTDSTPAICDEFLGKDHRIIVIHQTNGGLVRAWKAGVVQASGEYIAFCDSDDYVDDDLIEKTLDKAIECDADIVTFGAKAEYDDKSELFLDNKLETGFFSEDKLQEIKDQLLFTGKMQSQIILNSRWSKLYKSNLLKECLDIINDDLTNGEDAVTTYATVIRTGGIYNIAGYYPYHYYRNDQSMVGKYDHEWFGKMEKLRDELYAVEVKCGRNDAYQIENFFFSYVLMYAKKEIVRSKECKKDITNNLLLVRNAKAVENGLQYVDFSRYSLASRVFATLFVNKRMSALYNMTKFVSIMGYGKE